MALLPNFLVICKALIMTDYDPNFGIYRNLSIYLQLYNQIYPRYIPHVEWSEDGCSGFRALDFVIGTVVKIPIGKTERYAVIACNLTKQ